MMCFLLLQLHVEAKKKKLSRAHPCPARTRHSASAVTLTSHRTLIAHLTDFTPHALRSAAAQRPPLTRKPHRAWRYPFPACSALSSVRLRAVRLNTSSVATPLLSSPLEHALEPP
uniref:Uncharacterized protein n=1 Tax=Haptolina ericina TaxID=156174 RepID=A0A6T9NKN2_9EUKA|mmetsp:Transcript_66989/g.149479  ORF Transcript_66989/g.149479 Transcript_66989/m.149479 type:complete len:115 (+) Transcript_66989:75-419(+)